MWRHKGSILDDGSEFIHWLMVTRMWLQPQRHYLRSVGSQRNKFFTGTGHVWIWGSDRFPGEKPCQVMFAYVCHSIYHVFFSKNDLITVPGKPTVYRCVLNLAVMKPLGKTVAEASCGDSFAHSSLRVPGQDNAALLCIWKNTIRMSHQPCSDAKRRLFCSSSESASMRFIHTRTLIRDGFANYPAACQLYRDWYLFSSAPVIPNEY